MITCTFAGHREVYQASIMNRLDETISQIIETNEDSFCFLVGGIGDFDNLCSSAVRKAKRKYKDKHISLELVLPYFSQELNINKEYYEQSYDSVLIPSELAGVHYKSAITKRNRWLIDNSEYLIAFVHRDYGGAYTTLRYAQKRKRKIINLADTAH